MINFNSQGSVTNLYQTQAKALKPEERQIQDRVEKTEVPDGFALKRDSYVPSKEARELKETQESDPISKLSKKAQEIYKKLKEKYGDDTDLFVGNWSSDEEASSIMSKGTKEFSMLISPEELEKMAEDDDYASKKIEEIDAARGDIKGILEEAEKEGISVDKIGISIDSEGNTKFFAMLSKAAEEQKERIEKNSEKKTEDEKRAQKAEEREALNEKIQKRMDEKSRIQKASIEADSAQELLEKMHEIEWPKLEVLTVELRGINVAV